MEAQTTDIIVKSLDTIKDAPIILKNNSERRDKAILVGKNILTTIQQSGGLDSELDERCNNYLVNCRTALTEMNATRKGVTQIMDELKKMYTTVEAELDVKKAGSIPYQIQEERNIYAKKIAEEAEKKRKELETAKRKADEEISLKSEVLKKISERLINKIFDYKTKVQNTFNNITLLDFDIKSSSLINHDVNISRESIIKIIDVISMTGLYHSTEEVKRIVVAEIENYDYQRFQEEWVAEITELKNDLIQKLSSKKTELEEQKRIADEAEKARIEAEKAEKERQEAIAKAGAEEKKRLEKEAEEARKLEAERQAILLEQKAEADRLQKEREQEEANRLQKEIEDAKRKADEEAELKKQGELTMNMFTQEAELADIQEANARQGYEIAVSHPVGFTQLFAFWFEREGKNLGIDQLEKKSLGQIKSFCEKHAHKTGEKIDSKFLKYKETFKAVNKK